MTKIYALLFVISLLPVSAVNRAEPIGSHCLLPRPMVMAQEGNPGHHEPPPGWTCSQGPNVPADHACTCHRECKDEQNTDENGQATDGQHTEIKEDAKCRSFCYKDHCQCPVHNCE
jgi:hypothetical protein